MPDPRRTLIALLSACAFLVLSPVVASASSGATEYTPTAPGPEGPVPTNDIFNGDGAGQDDSTPVDDGSSGDSSAAVVAPPTKADEKLAGKGNAGNALLGLIGSTDRSTDLGVGSGGSPSSERTVGARLLDGAGGSAGAMGVLLYVLAGATLIWAVATAVGRKREAAKFS